MKPNCAWPGAATSAPLWQPARLPSLPRSRRLRPSRGILSHDFDPPRIARDYESGGAAALSVLTDEPFFQGCLADLERARAAVSLPVLRKDFTIDASQILEAAAHGADAILLIAAILTARQIRDFREIAARHRLSALVEVHNRRELDAAIDAGADLIGVNNRNLSTFEVTLETSLTLAADMPAGALLVSESGIHTAADIVQLRAAGYRAFLVGEHLMKSGDPAGCAAQTGGRMILKVCGITNQPDADAAIAAGATAIGFNFYPKSPRYLAPESAARIATPGVRRVGVFVNEQAAHIAGIASVAALDVAQLHGDETPAQYPSGIAVWKALRVSPGFDFSQWDESTAEALLLDGPAAELYGGAGHTFDWTLAHNMRHRIVVAGGLDASNVARAISLARPWGVDSCSRIESSPGKKDHMKMIDFLHAAKAALGA